MTKFSTSHPNGLRRNYMHHIEPRQTLGRDHCPRPDSTQLNWPVSRKASLYLLCTYKSTMFATNTTNRLYYTLLLKIVVPSDVG